MKSSNEHEYLLVGKIMAPFGIKGEMKVAVITSSKEKRFCAIGRICAKPFTPTDQWEDRIDDLCIHSCLLINTILVFY